jgi:hypothetical protein
VADHLDRLAGGEQVPDEARRGRILAQMTGVGGSPGQQERVVIIDRRVGHLPVHPDPSGLLDVVVHRLDLAGLDREHLGLRPGLFHGAARRDELDLLDSA